MSSRRGFEEVRKLLLCHVSQFERSHEAVEAQNKSHIIAKTIFHMLKQLLFNFVVKTSQGSSGMVAFTKCNVRYDARETQLVVRL